MAASSLALRATTVLGTAEGSSDEGGGKKPKTFTQYTVRVETQSGPQWTTANSAKDKKWRRRSCSRRWHLHVVVLLCLSLVCARMLLQRLRVVMCQCGQCCAWCSPPLNKWCMVTCLQDVHVVRDCTLN